MHYTRAHPDYFGATVLLLSYYNYYNLGRFFCFPQPAVLLLKTTEENKERKKIKSNMLDINLHFKSIKFLLYGKER